jgi:hypothetical protein
MTTHTTRDIGLAIRDHIEGKPVWRFDEDTEIADSDREVAEVDASDPNNLVLHMDNGQTFTVRIIAGG